MMHGNQKRLSDAVDDAALASLQTGASIAARAHLNLLQAPGAGAFLQAPPCEAAGARFPRGLCQ
eukprot:4205462-Pyramimonas_sp.AAC.1